MALIVISIHRNEEGENIARIIDLGDIRIVSMDIFLEGVDVPENAEVLNVANRYKIYIASEEAPDGKVEFMIYDNGSRKQLINIKYIGRLAGDKALAYLNKVVERLSAGSNI